MMPRVVFFHNTKRKSRVVKLMRGIIGFFAATFDGQFLYLQFLNMHQGNIALGGRRIVHPNE